MSLSIAFVVGGGLCAVAAVGAAVGAAGSYRGERERWASQAWRDVTVRGGVSEYSPFHAPESSFNAPGMVEVFPRSHRHNQVSQSAAAVVSSERPPVASVTSIPSATAVEPLLAPDDELPSTPLELSDPPHEAERARCRRLYSEGMSQTRVINAVWGIPKGGSKKYHEARRRFREHIADIAQGDLLVSIKSEEVSHA